MRSPEITAIRTEIGRLSEQVKTLRGPSEDRTHPFTAWLGLHAAMTSLDAANTALAVVEELPET